MNIIKTEIDIFMTSETKIDKFSNIWIYYDRLLNSFQAWTNKSWRWKTFICPRS